VIAALVIVRTATIGRMRLLVLVGFAVLSAARTAAAHGGDDRIAIAVVMDDEPRLEAGLRARVEQELALRGHGTAPLELADDALDEVALMAAAAREDVAIAVLVRLAADAPSIEIRLVDRVTGKSLRRVIDRSSDASTIALATAELVDASLVEVELPHTTMPRPRAAPEMPHPEVVPLPPQRWAFAAGVGVLWPVLQRTPIAMAGVSLTIRVVRRVAIAPEVILPLHPMVDRPESGTVRTLPFLVAVRTDVDVLPHRSRTRLDLQAAVTATALHVDASTQAAGLQAHPTTIWSAAALIGVAARRDFGRHFRIGGGLRSYIPFERVRVEAAGETVRDFGIIWPMPWLELVARW
jgi:hypothetical protein